MTVAQNFNKSYPARMKFIPYLLAVFICACSPRIELAASDKPITINMNIKIDHEVKVKVEKDLEQVISKDSNLF